MRIELKCRTPRWRGDGELVVGVEKTHTFGVRSTVGRKHCRVTEAAAEF